MTYEHDLEMDLIAVARTFLFVPGNRPDRFDKAISVRADAVIIDLEDSVAPTAKHDARAAVARWLSPRRPVLIRVNAGNSVWFDEDVMLCRLPGVLGVVLPKSEPGSALDRVSAVRPIVPLIETAVGMDSVAASASTRGVVRLALGAIDLALDLGIGTVDSTINPIRLQLVIASRLALIAPPIEGVTSDAVGGLAILKRSAV
jgi:citrate lyase subunit beta/citryl-CoA lyase